MSQTQQAHQRSRSHQNNAEGINRERATLRESGSSNANYANRIPVGESGEKEPPKTANPG